LCPDIAENYNLFQDGDWCPEIWINQSCDIRLQFPNLGWLFNWWRNDWGDGYDGGGGDDWDWGNGDWGDDWLSDLCLAAISEGTLWSFKCDMDKDEIPDVCDDDIDWDGYKNIIWIIKYENQNCSIWPWSGNNSWNNIDIEILKKHIWICYLDNAFYIINPDQLDINMNGIWDVFENQIKIIWAGVSYFYVNIKDGNLDGIPDYIDACTGNNNWGNNSGENNNWGNGVLPGGWNNIPNIPPIIQSECFQCPCNFSDIMNDLSKKDAVRASLWDKLWNVLYRVSESKSLDLNMD
jgi:hypothetical protein